MSLLLYSVVAAVVLFMLDRFVLRLSRAAALALLLLPFLFTGRALLTGAVYAPIDLAYQFEPIAALRAEYGIGSPRNVVGTDLIAQIIPWRKAVQWSLAHRQWPLWNPFILTGDILAAAAQPAPYSPLTLLASILPVAHGLTFSAALTLFIAAAGAFLFLRELHSREAVAVFAAAAWMYSTAIAFFVLWPIGASWAQLPLVLFATRRLVQAPSLRSTVLLTTSLVLLLLSGHPETALHVVTIGIAFGLFEIIRSRRWGAVSPALVAGAIALLLCAVYLLPLFEAAPQTAEHEYRKAVWASRPRGVPIGQSISRIAADFFPHLHLRKWDMAGAASTPADTAAVGSIVLAIAVFTMWRVRTAEVRFFIGLLLFALVAQAEPRWFETVMQSLPLFDVALNSRFAFGAAFALVVLAALGLEHAVSTSWRPLAATAAAVLAVLAAGTWAITNSGLIVGSQLPWANYKVAAELACLAAAVVLFWTRPKAVLPILLGLLLFQRFAQEGRAWPTLPSRAAYPPVPIFQAIAAREPFRIVATGNALPPGTSTLYGLEDARGYQALTLLRHADTYVLWSVEQPVWFNRIDDLTRPFLSFLNVRYAVTPLTDAIPEGWREVAAQPGTRLLENERVIPRAFIPRKVRLGTPESGEIDQMRGETDFSERAWIRASTEIHERTNGPGTVAVNRKGSQYDLDVDMKGSGWVVVSESAWNGWRAYIDGRRVKMQLANHAFLSVFVPEGKHRVRLVYLPQSFVAGRTITMATLLAIVIGFAWRFAAVRRPAT
jgi:hypothetical protein